MTGPAAAPAPALLVLAAGMGSRYGGLKQIDPVGPAGELVLDYSIHDAMRAGFGRVVFLIRREIETDFKAAIGRRYEGRLPVTYAYQERDQDVPAGFPVPAERRKPWGTGHAVLCARAALDGPFAVINADDFYGAASYQRIADFLRTPPPAAPAPEFYAMVGFQLRRTLSENGAVARGLCTLDAAGRLVTVEEHTRIVREGPRGARSLTESGPGRPLTGDEIVSMNLWGFRPSIFDFLAGGFARFLQERGADPKAEFYLPAAVADLLARGRARVQVLETPCDWFGITYREDKATVERGIRTLIAGGAYPSPLD